MSELQPLKDGYYDPMPYPFAGPSIADDLAILLSGDDAAIDPFQRSQVVVVVGSER